MRDDEPEAVILLDRPIVYVDADQIVDEVDTIDIDHDDKTAEYHFAPVDDDYDEVVVIEDLVDPLGNPLGAPLVDPLVDALDDVVLLDMLRLETADFELV